MSPFLHHGCLDFPLQLRSHVYQKTSTSEFPEHTFLPYAPESLSLCTNVPSGVPLIRKVKKLWDRVRIGNTYHMSAASYIQSCMYIEKPMGYILGC